jgi:group I intron endonuclease
MRSGIYIIVCKNNGHYYIGRALDYTKRVNQHKCTLRKGKHRNPRLQNLYNKYGEESLIFSLIIEIPRDEYIQEIIEQEIIDMVIDDENCVNINRTAGGGCIVPMTPERRKKISEAQKGEKSAWYGRKHTEETKRKISKAHKGKTVSEETRKKLSIAQSKKIGKMNPTSKAVLQIDPNTLEVIAEYDSVSDVNRIHGYDVSSIAKACRKELKKAYGYIWEYKEGATTISKGSRNAS